MLYDEMIYPESSDVKLLDRLFSKENKYLKWVLKSKTKFALNHFNQLVEYEITGFISKNTDPLSKNLWSAM